MACNAWCIAVVLMMACSTCTCQYLEGWHQATAQHPTPVCTWAGQEFDGTPPRSDRLDLYEMGVCQDETFGPPFSVMVTVRVDTFSDKHKARVFDFRSWNQNSDGHSLLFVLTRDATLLWQVWDHGAVEQNVNSGPVEIGVEHRWLMNVDVDGRMELYRDGVFEGSNNIGYAPKTERRMMRVGTDQNGNGLALDGLIKDMEIYHTLVQWTTTTTTTSTTTISTSSTSTSTTTTTVSSTTTSSTSASTSSSSTSSSTDSTSSSSSSTSSTSGSSTSSSSTSSSSTTSSGTTSSTSSSTVTSSTSSTASSTSTSSTSSSITTSATSTSTDTTSTTSTSTISTMTSSTSTASTSTSTGSTSSTSSSSSTRSSSSTSSSSASSSSSSTSSLTETSSSSSSSSSTSRTETTSTSTSTSNTITTVSGTSSSTSTRSTSSTSYTTSLTSTRTTTISTSTGSSTTSKTFTETTATHTTATVTTATVTAATSTGSDFYGATTTATTSIAYVEITSGSSGSSSDGSSGSSLANVVLVTVHLRGLVVGAHKLVQTSSLVKAAERILLAEAAVRGIALPPRSLRTSLQKGSTAVKMFAAPRAGEEAEEVAALLAASVDVMAAAMEQAILTVHDIQELSLPGTGATVEEITVQATRSTQGALVVPTAPSPATSSTVPTRSKVAGVVLIDMRIRGLSSSVPQTVSALINERVQHAVMTVATEFSKPFRPFSVRTTFKKTLLQTQLRMNSLVEARDLARQFRKSTNLLEGAIQNAFSEAHAAQKDMLKVEDINIKFREVADQSAIPPPIATKMEDLLTQLASGNETELHASIPEGTLLCVELSQPPNVSGGEVTGPLQIRVPLPEEAGQESMEVQVPFSAFSRAAEEENPGEELVMRVAVLSDASNLFTSAGVKHDAVQVEAAAVIEVSTVAGSDVSVSGLAEPIEFSLPTIYLQGLSCAFFDKNLGKWSSEGVSLADGMELGEAMRCRTTHLSVFGAVYISREAACAGLELATKGKWHSAPGAIFFWVLLAFLVATFVAAAAFDCIHQGKMRWTDAWFLVHDARPLPEGAEILDKPRNGEEGQESFVPAWACLDALREVAKEYVRNCKWLYMFIVQLYTEVWFGRSELWAYKAMSWLILASSQRLVGTSLGLQRQAVTFVLEDRDLSHHIAVLQEVREMRARDRASISGAVTAVLSTTEASWWERSTRDEAWSALREEIIDNMQNAITEHSCCAVPRMACQLFVASNPAASIFTVTPGRSCKLRATFLILRLLGDLAVVGFLFAQRGDVRAWSKAPRPCTIREEQQVGDILRAAFVSVLLSLLAVSLLRSLRTKKFRKLPATSAGAPRLLRAWMAQGCLVWLLAAALLALALSFLIALLASMNSEELQDWLLTGLVAMLVDIVALPFGLAFCVPALAGFVLTVMSKAQCVDRSSLTREVSTNLRLSTDLILPVFEI